MGADLVFYLERVTRIELALSAWEADVLPLNYTRERPSGDRRSEDTARRHRAGNAASLAGS